MYLSLCCGYLNSMMYQILNSTAIGDCTVRRYCGQQDPTGNPDNIQHQRILPRGLQSGSPQAADLLKRVRPNPHGSAPCSAARPAYSGRPLELEPELCCRPRDAAPGRLWGRSDKVRGNSRKSSGVPWD
ncbi:hypothetical protein NDU88_006114 [Pleurodeles waltl]|uniref:Uncharacterized protein n=1 Tax=Pleurodeles waltl TaxID=8319 RepID=A0AAV7TCF2_PLEWA|nr:hypothetical protein NDU88_006114 [Pleurodeles waltl]